MPNPSGYALLMDPTFVGPANNVRFSKVLIDNGSSINIMCQDMMQKLGIKENMLEPSKTTFHGIVLGLSCAPMGKIRIVSCLATGITAEWKTSYLRWWIWIAPTMRCWVGRHWRSSWPLHMWRI
jgi:hypothetical protein